MSARDIPRDIIRELRLEVGFTCPVPGCGSPLLTWHHFDPPWSEAKVHDPAGMVALCVPHHKKADAGTYSPEQLRSWKTSCAKPHQRLITEEFGWSLEACIIRLGGCYSTNQFRLVVDDESVFRVNKHASGGSLSFLLRDARGEEVAVMEENFFACDPSRLHDLTVSASGNRIRIWHGPRKVGIECHYSRLSLEQIEKHLTRDAASLPPDDLSPQLVTDPTSFYALLSQVESQDELAELALRRNDPTGTFVRWHAARNLGSDSRIPFLDVVSGRFFGRNRKEVIMRDGRLHGVTFTYLETIHV